MTVAVGAVLVLTVMARDLDLGPGVFPLAAGVAALVFQLPTHWMDAPAVRAWQPWLGVVLALLIGVGALSVAVLSALDGGHPFVVQLVFCVASLVAKLVFDFEGVWGGLLNVSLVLFAAGCVLGVVFLATEMVEGMDGPDRERVARGYEYPSTTYELFWGVRFIAFGLAVTAVTIAIVVSFSMPTFVDVLLVLLAALGVYTVVPLAGYAWVVRAFGRERFERMGSGSFEEAVMDGAPRLPTVSALVAGFLAVVLVCEVVLLWPAVWVTSVLLGAATAAGAVAVRCWLRALPRLVDGLGETERTSEQSASSIASVLVALGLSQPVFRLLPGSDGLAPGASDSSSASEDASGTDRP
ncbi:hypothetical protein [Streptomyces paludis]|uniref:hypothetical protein n=1 Tax=Streptomyces paludis TaxID=2282738 RepID=UPI0013B42ACB|nr:hypothetical protein [Streptomyces paludis]